MSFSALVSAMDTTLLSVLSSGLTVTIHSHSAWPTVTVPCLTKNPALEEDFVPGSAQGVSVLMLFVKAVDCPNADNGDTATVGGVDYDVMQVNVDREGGMTLRMRRRVERWDQ